MRKREHVLFIPSIRKRVNNSSFLLTVSFITDKIYTAIVLPSVIHNLFEEIRRVINNISEVEFK